MRAPPQRWKIWLLLLALLNAVLGPSANLAHGKVGDGHALLIPVCAEDGVRYLAVELPGANDASDPHAAHTLEHDGFCLLCFCPAAPSDIASVTLTLEVSSAIPPISAIAPAPQRASVWRPALPRAPPSSL